MKSIGQRLILAASMAFPWACGPKAIDGPQPQTPATVETSADAGLPNVPLTGRGVVVPSDVKLEPGPKGPTPSTSTATGPGPASPGTN